MNGTGGAARRRAGRGRSSSRRYVANVVGEKNYKYFCAFLVLVVVTISLHLVLVVPRLSLCGLLDGDDARAEAAGRRCVGHRSNALLLLGTALAVLHLIWVTCMVLMHATLVCHDQTTYESIRGGPGTAAPPSLANCERALCEAPDAAPLPPPDAAVELV